ncbi:MAG: MFS transporter [Romboutsia sp.]
MDFKNIFGTYKGLSKEVYILFIGRIVNSLGAFVHPLMALILTQKIGLSVAEAGMFVTTLSIFQAPAMMIGGKLADNIGRRKVIIVFQLLGAITLIYCGFMEPSTTMAKVMILSSCFYSMSSPAFEALNADITTPKNRKASYSLLYMGSNIGFCIGPIIGGLLYENYLPLIFIGDGITTLVALILIILFIKEGLREECIDEELESISNLEKEVEGSVFKVLIKRPILIFFSIGTLMYYFSYSQWGFALPIQLEHIFSESGAKLYGVLGGLNGVVVILLTPILTTMTKKTSILKTMAIGGIFYIISFGMFGFINLPILFFIAIFIMTIGEILITINQGTFIANNTPASHRGRVSSILPLISGLGFAIGPMIMGDIIEIYSILTGWIVVALVSALGMIIMISLEKFMKRQLK